MRRLISVIAGCFLMLTVWGQSRPDPRAGTSDFRTFQGDTTILTTDSTGVRGRTPKPRKAVPIDSLVSVDTASIDSIAAEILPQGDIETTINYNARDSIFFDMGSSSLTMYGETHIDYGEISLDAEETEVSMIDRTITSTYSLDTAGKKVGKPVFTENEDIYETEYILYNFDTKRAQIKGVVTEQEGAYMHGHDVKKNEKNEMYITGARYTTCNLAHPHFYIESEKLKVSKRNVISGPFNLRFREVITPLWFPFGMFPQPKQKTSGIIMPNYGEETRRGFFLRDGGYYWAISDYMDLRATADIYSKGGYGVNVNTNYRKRYAYSGTFNFSHTRNISDDPDQPLNTSDYWVRWSHRPETRGNTSFSASVSAGTSTFNENNNLVNQDFQRSIKSDFTSNVSYSQKFSNAPFNLNMNARHNQNIQSGQMTLSLPELTVNMNRQFPLKNLNGRNVDILKKLGFSYNFVAKNELTNNPNRSSFPSSWNIGNVREYEDGELAPMSLETAKIGGKHAIPVSTSMRLLKNFTLNPSFNYTDYWYTRELDYTYIPEDTVVHVDTVNTFSRAGSWNTGASLNTIIYGTHFFRPGSHIQAIRHVMTPSLSFSYSPDFGTPEKGVYEWVQVNEEGDSVLMSKYYQFAYGSPSGSGSKTMSFSLQNNLEMKVKDKKDTTGVGYKKVKIFDNLSFSSGYNFAADSFKLSPIRFSTRTSFFNRAVSLNLTGTVDPYTYSATETSSTGEVTSQDRIDRFAWQNGNGLGNLSQFNTAISLNLKPKKSKGKDDDTDDGRGTGSRDGDPFDPNDINNPNYRDDMTLEDEAELEHIYRNPNEYVDFDIPWTFRASYNIGYRQVGLQDPTITQTLSFSGDLSLTPKTKIRFSSGYDLERQAFTATSIGIDRNLHCWQLTFNWVPFGRYQSFNVVIRPKSALLQDLKLQKRKNFQDFFQ